MPVEPTRTNTLKRIAGVVTQVEAEYDGVQRAEWLSDGEGRSFGRLHTGRYDDGVSAFRDGDSRKTRFRVSAHGSKARALNAARKWIVEGSRCAARLKEIDQ